MLDAIYNGLLVLVPVWQAQHDAGGNAYFDGRAFQDYLVAWLTVNAIKE